MSQTPEVSIITPTFNNDAFIADTARSVLNQTFQNWEMIIVDDCSSDRTRDEISKLAHEDSRIRFDFLKQNLGPAHSRNRAIELSKGRFIAFLDGDDLWIPKKLEVQLAFMKERDAALTCTSYKVIEENGAETGRVVRVPEATDYKTLLKNNTVGCLTAIYDSKKIGKTYMPLIRKRQDYGLWLSILRQGHEAHGLDEVLAIYRERKNSVSSNKVELIKYNWQLLREVEKLSLPASAYYLGRQTLSALTKSLSR